MNEFIVDGVTVRRVCQGKKGMCLNAVSKGTISCPLCGSRNFKIEPTEDDAACLLPTRDLVREDPIFTGFSPGHNMQGQGKAVM